VIMAKVNSIEFFLQHAVDQTGFVCTVLCLDANSSHVPYLFEIKLFLLSLQYR
jgi:hypothetical protein